MFSLNIKNEKFSNFFSYCLAFFPLSLILGIFIAELVSFFCILYFVFCLDKQNYNKYLLNNFSKFFIIFYLLILITSLINFYNFRWFVPALFYFRFFLFALSIWYILDNSNFFEGKKKYIIIFTFFILIIDSLFQAFTGVNLIGYEIQSFGRISSFFYEDLILGGFILRLLPIVIIALLLNSTQKIHFLTVSFFLTLSFLIIIYSGERVSTILSILYVFLLFFLSAKIRKILITALIILGVILSIISTFNIGEVSFKQRLWDKTIEQIYGEDTNPIVDERTEITRKSDKVFGKFYIFSYDHHSHYLLASKMIKDSPIFGKGVRGFRWLCNKTDKYKNIDNMGCSTHPHNTYVQILVSTGIFGFMMILFLFFYVIRIYLKNLSAKLNQKNEYLVYQNILIGIMIVNLWPLIPSGNFYNNFLSLLYFYPVGFYFYFKNKKNDNGKIS